MANKSFDGAYIDNAGGHTPGNDLSSVSDNVSAFTGSTPYSNEHCPGKSNGNNNSNSIHSNQSTPAYLGGDFESEAGASARGMVNDDDLITRYKASPNTSSSKSSPLSEHSSKLSLQSETPNSISDKIKVVGSGLRGSFILSPIGKGKDVQYDEISENAVAVESGASPTTSDMTYTPESFPGKFTGNNNNRSTSNQTSPTTVSHNSSISSRSINQDSAGAGGVVNNDDPIALIMEDMRKMKNEHDAFASSASTFFDSVVAKISVVRKDHDEELQLELKKRVEEVGVLKLEKEFLEESVENLQAEKQKCEAEATKLRNNIRDLESLRRMMWDEFNEKFDDFQRAMDHVHKTQEKITADYNVG